MTYIVTSDNFVGGARGTVLDDDQLGGCDVAALVEGGHLAPQNAPSSPGAAQAMSPSAPPAATPASPPSSPPASGASTEPATPAP